MMLLLSPHQVSQLHQACYHSSPLLTEHSEALASSAAPQTLGMLVPAHERQEQQCTQ
jgi:hypothetical protein